MIKRRRKRKTTVLKFTAFLLILAIIITASYVKMRPVIIKYAVSVAETLFLNAANAAVVEVLNVKNIKYDDIINLSRDSNGSVTSLETNIIKINEFKSSISNKIAQIIDSKEYYDIKIPLGTFFANSYTSGLGPKLHFKMQVTSTSVVDFQHKFESAGINQVLHMVILTININGSLILTGAVEPISVKTSSIAAQTVIVGASPDSFTNVLESPLNNTAELINDYGATNSK